MENELTVVYSGSRVEGQFIAEILKENGIGSIYRDVLQESVDGGWANSLPENAVQIQVETEFAAKAKQIIDEYFRNRDKK